MTTDLNMSCGIIEQALQLFFDPHPPRIQERKWWKPKSVVDTSATQREKDSFLIKIAKEQRALSPSKRPFAFDQSIMLLKGFKTSAYILNSESKKREQSGERASKHCNTVLGLWHKADVQSKQIVSKDKNELVKLRRDLCKQKEEYNKCAKNTHKENLHEDGMIAAEKLDKQICEIDSDVDDLEAFGKTAKKIGALYDLWCELKQKKQNDDDSHKDATRHYYNRILDYLSDSNIHKKKKERKAAAIIVDIVDQLDAIIDWNMTHKIIEKAISIIKKTSSRDNEMLLQNDALTARNSFLKEIEHKLEDPCIPLSRKPFAFRDPITLLKGFEATAYIFYSFDKEATLQDPALQCWY